MRSLLTLAAHEAAHVVVSHVLGLPVRRVVIDTKGQTVLEGHTLLRTLAPAEGNSMTTEPESRLRRCRAVSAGAGEFFVRWRLGAPADSLSYLWDRILVARSGISPSQIRAALAAVLTMPGIEEAVWRVAVALLERQELEPADLEPLLSGLPQIRD